MTLRDSGKQLADTLATVERLVQWDSPRQALMGTQLRVLLTAYHYHWQFEPWDTVGIELAQHLPIIDPDTMEPIPGFTHAGKLDLLLRDRKTGRHFIGEHKTASDDIGNPDAPYWQRLTVDGQVSKYQLQCFQSGIEVDGVLYDVARKPKTDPKLIPAKSTKSTPVSATRQGVLAFGTYHGHDVTDATCERLQRESDAGERSRECLELYGLRLLSIVMGEPEAWLVRRIITRSREGIAEYNAELAGLAHDLERERARGLHPRNSASCWDFNRACPFLGLCAGTESLQLDTGRWAAREFVHPELAADFDADADAVRELPGEVAIEQGDGGRNVITNSRLKVFQSCRRKHHYQYDLGLTRVGRETAEALWMGDVFHQAMETWWAFYLPDTATKGEDR